MSGVRGPGRTFICNGRAPHRNGHGALRRAGGTALFSACLKSIPSSGRIPLHFTLCVIPLASAVDQVQWTGP